MAALCDNNPFESGATYVVAPIELSAKTSDAEALRTVEAADLGAPIYLRSMAPHRQLRLEEICGCFHAVAVDTEPSWVEAERTTVLAAMRRATIAFMDTGEALGLTGLARWVPAAHYLVEVGIPIVVMKHGEYGASLFSKWCQLRVPSYPAAEAIGAEGLGDAFAGGFLGAIAKAGGDLGRDTLATAMIAGCVTASFAVEGAAPEKLSGASAELLSSRFDELVAMTAIPD